MKTSLLLSLSLPALLALSGCTPPASSLNGKPSGGVAILDIDAVARRLGRDTIISQELKDTGDDLSTKLQATQKEFQQEFQKSRDAVGATPTEADSQKLSQLGQDLNQQFQKKQQEAQAELSAKRTALVTHFREEVKPVAMRIASSKGFDLVLLKSDMVVLGNQPTVEITDAVVSEMVGSSETAAPSPTASATATP